MSNPIVAPKIDLANAGEASPDAFFTADAGYVRFRAIGNSLEVQKEYLEELDMELRGAVVLRPTETLDPSVISRIRGESFALAKSGKPSFRIRTGAAKRVTTAIWRALPETGFGSKENVRATMMRKFYVDAGTAWTLGRLKMAYPKKGVKPRSPITASEAARALDNCGLRIEHLPGSALRAYPLHPEEGEQTISINPKSDNGFPVLCQWDTPGASDLILRLAVGIRQEIRAASHLNQGVKKWKEEKEVQRPSLVLVRGKAKADYYPQDKICEQRLRFYNAFPRQVVLNMQVVTQPFEALSRNILTEGHSGIGITLTRFGGARLVMALEQQLIANGWAYVHVGDDSWVALLEADGKRIVWFALDCSNFDLTQHSTVSRHVHEEIHTQLRCIDKPAADLWLAFARSRLVAVSGAMVFKWEHAGPSGMPLQSKVNDMLMDVMINRVLALRQEGKDEVWWDGVIKQVGTDMGFVVKVEQFASIRAPDLRAALEQVPFLFIGYYFHVKGGVVNVYTDLPRTMGQMPYPSQKWIKEGRDVLVLEAMRLGSMFMSAGIPPYVLEPAHEAWQKSVVALLDEALRYGDVNDEKLRWAVQNDVFGPAVASSLSGLRAAVLRDPKELWMEEEKEMATATSQLYVPLEGGSWADQVELEDLEAIGRVVTVPVGRPLPLPLFLKLKPIPTHPITWRNVGRPAPTAVWGPDKPKRRIPVRYGRVLADDEVSERFVGRYGPEDTYSEYDPSVETEEDMNDTWDDYPLHEEYEPLQHDAEWLRERQDAEDLAAERWM